MAMIRPYMGEVLAGPMAGQWVEADAPTVTHAGMGLRLRWYNDGEFSGWVEEGAAVMGRHGLMVWRDNAYRALWDDTTTGATWRVVAFNDTSAPEPARTGPLYDFDPDLGW